MPPKPGELRIPLHLEGHCIQTAARHALRDRQARLLEEETDPDEGLLEAELELLIAFLESHDFPRLRAARPELGGGQPITVEVHWDDAGRATFSP